MPETHELPLDVIRKAWDENVKPGAQHDEAGSPWASFTCYGNEERATKFARAIVTAARQSDEAGKREAAYEALDYVREQMAIRPAVDKDIALAVMGHALSSGQGYLAKTYPLPARECVLSDGATVHFNDEDNVLVRTGARRVTLRRIRVCWQELLHEDHTGADWDALKSFAAGVGR